jgi:hypothetical protein
MKITYFFFFALFVGFSFTLAQNQQLQFDGVDDFCNVLNAETLFSNLDVFTVEVWIKGTDFSNAPIFIGSSSNEVLFGIASAEGIAFNTSFFSAGSFVGTLPGTFPADGMWHHVACVRTGPGAGHGKIYIDGVDQTDPTANTPGAAVTLSGNLTFGVGLVGLGSYFINGAMDDLRIWNVERSQGAINNNMNVELAGNEAGLIGYWRFNEGSGQDILDSQTNGTQYNGTLGTDNNPASDDPTRILDPNLPLPVELVSFNSSVHNNTVELSWITATEINNLGFDVERKAESGSYSKIGFVPGNGTSTEYSNYSFTDVLDKAGTYHYRLKWIDYDGSFEYSGSVQVEIEIIPILFKLEQNYPNPFNPSTTISYSLPEPGMTKLEVYNSLGQKVEEIVNEFLESGNHQTLFNAENLASGLYIYRIEVVGASKTYRSSKVMSLVK